MIREMHAAIFDLDGVIVDTAKYHYLAWKRLANECGFDFTEIDNERLKGVSRMRSLEILLEIGGINLLDEAAKQSMARQKNGWYVEYVNKMEAAEILPGAVDYIRFIRGKDVRTALASASRNAPLILERLQITPLFDVVMDSASVRNPKPDPEIFTRAAENLGIDPEYCAVFEDAEAGIEAAKRAGMASVGIGNPAILKEADMVIPGFQPLLALFALQVKNR